MLKSWTIGLDKLMFIVHNIDSDKSKIQLASIRLGGTALVWWKGRAQADMKRHGKIISI